MSAQPIKNSALDAFLGKIGRRLACFSVRPRYTPGSPAMVHPEVAVRVAAEERRAHEHALSGAWGEVQQQRAEALGLGGVAYVMAEQGSGRNFRWRTFDLVTHEESLRPHDTEIERLGFSRFEYLPQHVQTRIMQPGCRSHDYSQRFFKMTARGDIESFRPTAVHSEETMR